MGTLKYLFLACLIIKISSCYILRAQRRIPSSDLRPFSRPIYRPFSQSVYPRPRIRSHGVGLPFASRGRLQHRNLENLNLNNINNNNNNDGNQVRPVRGSRRIIRITRTQLAPPRIRYPPGVRRLDRRLIRSGRLSSISRIPSTGISRPSRRKIATRSKIRKIPDRSKDKVMALFALDGSRAKQMRTPRRRVNAQTSKIRPGPIIKPQGLSSLPVASEVMAKTTSIQRIEEKKAPTNKLKPIEGSVIAKSKTVGTQIEETKITKQELQATKHGQTQIVEKKIVPKNPAIVPAAIFSKETKPKVDVKQDLIVADADTVNIKTGVVGKATEKAQVIMKEPAVQKSTTDLLKSTRKLSKEATPIKTVEIIKDGTKKEKLPRDSAVIIQDIKGNTAETLAKSSISVKDADTVNIKAETIASSGEATRGSKNGTMKKVVVPNAVVVDKKTIANANITTTGIKKVSVAKTVALDKKTVVVDTAKGTVAH